MEVALTIANRFLKESFDSNVDITLDKLQILIYIFYREHLYRTKTKLFFEGFSSRADIPILMSVQGVFADYGKHVLDDFHSGVNGRCEYIDLSVSKEIRLSFLYAWNLYKVFDDKRLRDFVNIKNGALYTAKSNKQDYLRDTDIFNGVSLLNGCR